MNLVESIRIALRALLANKLRAVLTMLGIIIGVGAVIALMSVGKGVEQFVSSSFQGLGSNLLFVFPGSLDGTRDVGRPPELTTGDYEALADPFQVPDALLVAPAVSSNADVVAGKRSMRTEVSGTTPSYALLRNLKVDVGQFVSEADVNARSRVAVLGSWAYEQLFEEGAYPIEQTIKINQVPFRVVGVMEEKGGAGFGGGEDSTIYVPLSTGLTRLFPFRRTGGGAYRLSSIYVQVVSEERMDAATQQVSEVLRQRHGISFRDDDDFTVVKQTDMLAIAGDIASVLTLFLGSIAAISLLVGGIGIMNIMLVSVTERTREIGIRKAVGAKRRDILAQFLVEAVVLSLLGGFVGIALGMAGSRLVSGLSEQLTTVVTPDTVLLATGFSAAVGLFFGIYPATRAASLNPIDALRYE
jgi:putative ABC transport system permease protein